MSKRKKELLICRLEVCGNYLYRIALTQKEYIIARKRYEKLFGDI